MIVTLSSLTRRVLGAAMMTAVLSGFHGCGPEGSGTIKIDPGARERALNPGGNAAQPATVKEGKAKEAEAAAAKKNPKLY